PLEIIRELLLEFTQFTLAPTLPTNFPGNLFDYYLENTPPTFEDPDISPIPRSKGISSFITHRSITTRLEPEDLDDPFSLPPYNEDTTVINFPPRRNFLPSSPLVDIPLRTPSRIPSPAPTTASSPNPLTRFINFITPGRLNNPPPPHHTVYPIYPEETDPVPPIIVDINLPNEEPIRTPTPEAPLALTDAANAINALAVALGQAMAYMKDNAQEWASSLANAPNHFQHDNHGQNNQN
ncbi:33727_t:CDS:2, partial [Gigaspora margarita]